LAEATPWRRCSACKKPIALGAVYWACNVSTCNQKRTALCFCSVSCWEVHLPGANHREAWAVEKRAPTTAAPGDWAGPPRRPEPPPASGHGLPSGPSRRPEPPPASGHGLPSGPSRRPDAPPASGHGLPGGPSRRPDAPPASGGALPGGPSRRPEAGARRLVRGPAAPAPEAAPREVLIVASRLKEYVRARVGYNTSDRVLEPLSDIVRRVVDQAIENARRDGRMTVLDRDIPGL